MKVTVRTERQADANPMSIVNLINGSASPPRLYYCEGLADRSNDRHSVWREVPTRQPTAVKIVLMRTELTRDNCRRLLG